MLLFLFACVHSFLGHPFQDGNKRTGGWLLSAPNHAHIQTFFPAFFIANEYLRAMGIPGLADEGKVGEVYDSESVADIAKRHIDVAAGKSGVADLATPTSSLETR